MKPGNEIISHNIKLLREIEGLGQSEFGIKYGSNQKSIWAYEAGNSKPKSNFILNLSAGTGITPEVLLSLKLKKDRHNRITNIPSKDQEIQTLKNELKALTSAFQNDVQRFFKGIEKINERLLGMEKRIK